MLLATSAYANPTCTLSPDKKRLITELLCGQHSLEQAYRKFGQGCVANSIAARLEDSAVQIHFYKLCGFGAFSEQLREANESAVEFIKILAVCSGETIKVEKIMDDKLSYVAQRAAGSQCSQSMLSKLKQRREFFQAQIDQSKDPSLLPQIFNKLNIVVDSSGNISEAK